jgi:hypothetical protein
VAVQNGQLYTSTDSGLSWAPRDSSRLWQAMAASSGDGARLGAAVSGGQIYTSHNTGATSTTAGTAGFTLGSQGAALERP